MHSADPQPAQPRGPTKSFAALNHVEPQSVLKRLCQTGSYHGVVPQKLASGLWDWPLLPVRKQQAATLAAPGNGGA